MIQSYTTRKRRADDDLEFPDHIFISQDRVKEYVNKMIAYTKIGDAEYFATIDQLHNSDFYVIDPPGYNELKFRLQLFKEDVQLVPIYVHCDKEIAKERAIKRGQYVNDFEERYHSEDSRFIDFENGHLNECVIIDNSFEFDKSVKNMIDVIEFCLEVNNG